VSHALFSVPRDEGRPHDPEGHGGLSNSDSGPDTAGHATRGPAPDARLTSNVRSLRYGDQAPTFEQLFHTHRLVMVRLAVLLVDEQALAEDVVQDAFANLHAHWSRLHDHHAAVGYLRRSVINGARSALRRRRTARAYVPPHTPHEASAEAAALLAHEHREVLAAVLRLPHRQREVLVLRYWSDLGEAEISQTLGISRGAVKSTASRGLDAVARMLEATR
jgi:RNA polymerase sigma-70 factor (sigma-E family)